MGKPKANKYRQKRHPNCSKAARSQRLRRAAEENSKQEKENLKVYTEIRNLSAAAAEDGTGVQINTDNVVIKSEVEIEEHDNSYDLLASATNGDSARPITLPVAAIKREVETEDEINSGELPAAPRKDNGGTLVNNADSPFISKAKNLGTSSWVFETYSKRDKERRLLQLSGTPSAAVSETRTSDAISFTNQKSPKKASEGPVTLGGNPCFNSGVTSTYSKEDNGPSLFTLGDTPSVSEARSAISLRNRNSMNKAITEKEITLPENAYLNSPPAETAPRKGRQVVRDFGASDMRNPSLATKFYKLANAEIEKQKIIIAKLRRRVTTLTKKLKRAEKQQQHPSRNAPCGTSVQPQGDGRTFFSSS